MAGGSKSSSKPVDVTPEVFKNLQGPYASVIGQLLGFGPTQQPAAPAAPAARAGGVTQAGQVAGRASAYTMTPEQFLQSGQGGAPYTQRNFQPGGSSSYSGGSSVRQTSPVAAAGGSSVVPNFSPTGDVNDVLRGIPKYEGPLVAGLGDNERQLLDLLMQQQTGGGAGSPAQQTLQGFLSGQPTNAVGYTPEGTLSEFTQGLQNAQQTQGYDPNEINPMMQAYIEATQRPILESLEETLTRSLPGRFTEAGQFTQRGTGSSAFDRAAAIATRGAAQAQADIGTRIGFETLESERGRQFTAQEGARQREAEAMGQELARRGEYGEAARGREFTAGESAQDRALDAAKALPGVSRAEIDTTIANLQAQALPRLVEQLGIEQGIEQFQNQMNELLAILGIGAGVTAPVIGQESKSKTKPNVLGAL